jgi:hypothetical protein
MGMFGQIQFTWSSQMVVNENTNLGYARPKIALTSDNTPVVMWSRRSNKEVYVSKMVSGNFTAPNTITPSGVNAFAQDWAGPDMVAKENKVYVVFEAEPHGQGFIYIAISEDWGSTYKDTIRVSNNALTRFPTIAVAPDGTLYVGFMVFEPGDKDPHYAVSVSKDGGTTFSTAIKATGTAPGESCDCCPAYLVANNQGVIIFFRNNDNNLRDVWGSISTDTAKSFQITKKVDNTNWTINACPSSGPSAISTEDSFATVWMSGSSGNTRVYVSTSSAINLGMGSHSLIQPSLTGLASQNFPIISGRFDTYGVVWEEIDNGFWKIRFTATSKGASSLAGQQVYTINLDSTGYAKNPHMIYANGVFHITWQDNKSRKVYYRSAKIKGFTSISNVNSADLLASPNPSESGLFQLENIKLNSNLSIWDINGNLVWSQNNSISKKIKLDLSEYAKGPYIFSEELNGVVIFRKLLYN